MNVIIKSIPHAQHRYSTCGDWFITDGVLNILVSEEMPEASRNLVALHEYAEALMCLANGVTQKQVDDFDMEFERARVVGDDSEPGDSLMAPYFTQHGLATGIERIVATQMNVCWPLHEMAIGKLFDDPASPLQQ